MKDDQVYLQHILEALEKIASYTNGFTYESFLENNLVTDAVIRELEIIGEAAGEISEEFKNAHPVVPWKKITGMRNRLIHEYFGVDRKIVWETCQMDLKELERYLKPLVGQSSLPKG